MTARRLLSLALLRELNAARAKRLPRELVAQLEGELEAWDRSAPRVPEQLELASYRPPPCPPRPRACEECEARRPDVLATSTAAGPRWLCQRCRNGTLPDDERRALDAHRRRKETNQWTT